MAGNGVAPRLFRFGEPPNSGGERRRRGGEGRRRAKCTAGHREWWRRSARGTGGELGVVRRCARRRQCRYLGDGNRQLLPHAAAIDHERNTRSGRHRWGYDAPGNGWRSSRRGTDRGAGRCVAPGERPGVNTPWMGRHRCRNRWCTRDAARLSPRRNGAGKDPVDGQRRGESGGNAGRSPVRGTHRMSTCWDAIVVGAGPAGSATALLLARGGGGGRVRRPDRAKFPREKPCSEYLSPETTRVLERLGTDVLDAVAPPAPAHLTGMRVVAPSGKNVVGRFETFSYALPRTKFDSILRDAAERAGAEVRERVKVEELIYEH